MIKSFKHCNFNNNSPKCPSVHNQYPRINIKTYENDHIKDHEVSIVLILSEEKDTKAIIKLKPDQKLTKKPKQFKEIIDRSNYFKSICSKPNLNLDSVESLVARHDIDKNNEIYYQSKRLSYQSSLTRVSSLSKTEFRYKSIQTTSSESLFKPKKSDFLRLLLNRKKNLKTSKLIDNKEIWNIYLPYSKPTLPPTHSNWLRLNEMACCYNNENYMSNLDLIDSDISKDDIYKKTQSISRQNRVIFRVNELDNTNIEYLKYEANLPRLNDSYLNLQNVAKDLMNKKHVIRRDDNLDVIVEEEAPRSVKKGEMSNRYSKMAKNVNQTKQNYFHNSLQFKYNSYL